MLFFHITTQLILKRQIVKMRNRIIFAYLLLMINLFALIDSMYLLIPTTSLVRFKHFNQ